MARISAGNNLTIDTSADQWRLLSSNGDGREHVLVEAASGQPLRYMAPFGHRRRLPDSGLLPTLYIQRVVLGWSVKDEAWHLGLLLESELAEARGSRWCEIAHWPDPDRDLYGEVAAQAGTGLAKAITRPFDVIPPRDAGQSAGLRGAEGASSVAPPVYTPVPRTDVRTVAPDRPLPALPVTLDLWRFEQLDPEAYQFTLSAVWSRSRLLRILWYAFWTAVYILLSVTTLQGQIALPRPEFLPYLGLVSAAVLLLLVLSLIYQLLTVTNRIVVDGRTRSVHGLHGRRRQWTLHADEIQSVYVSQVVSRKPRRDKRTIHFGEINLHKADGTFRFLIETNQVEEKSSAFDGTPGEEAVMALTPNLIETSLQTAGMYTARALGLPCWYDQRFK